MSNRILVVEDEKTIRNLYQRIFSEMDYSVTLVENIAKAKAEIKRNKYDLFITDLLFPDGIGTDLIDLIKKKNAGSGILLITGRLTHKERLIYVKKFGLLACVAKPFSIYKFMTIIENYLRG